MTHPEAVRLAFLTDMNLEDRADRLILADWMDENGRDEEAALLRGDGRVEWERTIRGSESVEEIERKRRECRVVAIPEKAPEPMIDLFSDAW